MNESYTNNFKKISVINFLECNKSMVSYCQDIHVPVKTFEKWVHAYRQDKECFDYIDGEDAKFRIIKQADNIINDTTNYDGLTEEELKHELLKKDIELARLKKNYAVRINALGEKEYVTFSKKTTK